MRTPTRTILAGCLSAALLAGGASQALAASANGALEYCQSGDECRYFPNPRLRVPFTAAPGEMNSVSGLTSATATRIRDANVNVTPGNSCSSIDPHEVECGPAG